MLYSPFYTVTIQIVSNLPLTSKQKFRFSMRPMYQNTTFVLISMGGLNQRDVSPCGDMAKWNRSRLHESTSARFLLISKFLSGPFAPKKQVRSAQLLPGVGRRRHGRRRVRCSRFHEIACLWCPFLHRFPPATDITGLFAL